jgi:hypothetical protein
MLIRYPERPYLQEPIVLVARSLERPSVFNPGSCDHLVTRKALTTGEVRAILEGEEQAVRLRDDQAIAQNAAVLLRVGRKEAVPCEKKGTAPESERKSWTLAVDGLY